MWPWSCWPAPSPLPAFATPTSPACSKMVELSPLNIAALSLFAVCWLFYQPLLNLLSRGGGAAINTDLMVVRSAWMHNMARRENRFMDGQLLAQTLSSSSFFASSNLILIAATAGVLFGGQASF